MGGGIQNQYARNRVAMRRAIALSELGGKCCACGSSERLEFDHIDPATKVNSLTAMFLRSEAIFRAELAKCQLLCRDCHAYKSILEAGKAVARGTHGTLSSFRYCKCDDCRGAKKEWQKAYDAARRAKPRSLQQQEA